jgi:hypothetical protein
MFRDDAQKHRAIAALLGSTPALTGLWTEEGPTDRAAALAEQGGPTLSAEERALLLAACDIAGERTGLPFAAVLRLDPARLEALASLLVASDRGAGAVDGWIEGHTAPLPRCSGCGDERPAPERGTLCPDCVAESAPPVSATTPPILVDAILVAAVQLLGGAAGERVSLDSVRKDFGKLSDDAIALSLLHAERRGVLTLEADPTTPPGAFSIAATGRGVLGWVRLR